MVGGIGMSRIGKQPIAIPSGVTVTINDDHTVTVSGKLGTLTQEVSRLLNITLENNELKVSPVVNTKDSNRVHGLYRTLLANMVQGVSQGFEKTLIINGVGYKAFQKGADVQMNIGFSHPVDVKAVEGITLTVVNPTELKISGYDKQKVGQVAANIRAIKPVEPYHAYGIRYNDEVVVRKEGKTAGKK